MSSNKTKAQLVSEIKLLKDKIREFTGVEKAQKQNDDATVELPLRGFSVLKVGEGYKRVVLSFDLESNLAKIVGVEDASRLPSDRDMALYEAKKFLVESIISQELYHNE